MRLVDVTLPVTGLPPALDGLRIGLITDIHHSESVSADDVYARGRTLLQRQPARNDRAGRRLCLVRRAALRRAGRRAAGAAGRRALRRRSPCSAITTTIARCRRRSEPRGFTVLRDQRTRLEIRGRDARSRRTPFLDTARRRPRPGADGDRRDDVSARARSATPDRGRRVRRANSCSPATRTADRCCCPALAPSPAGSFRCWPEPGAKDNATLFVSRGVGTVYVPVRINCPPEVVLLTLQCAA